MIGVKSRNSNLLAQIWSLVKIQIMVKKITENLGFKSPFRKVKTFLSFLLIFKFFTQNWVSLTLTNFWYLVLLFRNQIKQDIKKLLNINICSFLWRIWKWKKKDKKIFNLPEWGFKPIFSWKGGWLDQIKLLKEIGLYKWKVIIFFRLSLDNHFIK